MRLEPKTTDIEFHMGRKEFIKSMKFFLIVIGAYGLLTILKLLSFDVNIVSGLFVAGIILSIIYGDYQEWKYRKKNGLWYSRVKVNYSDGTSEEMRLLERIDDSLLVDKLVHAGNRGLSVRVEILK